MHCLLNFDASLGIDDRLGDVVISSGLTKSRPPFKATRIFCVARATSFAWATRYSTCHSETNVWVVVVPFAPWKMRAKLSPFVTARPIPPAPIYDRCCGLDQRDISPRRHADGSVDIYIGPQGPAGQESNWL